MYLPIYTLIVLNKYYKKIAQFIQCINYVSYSIMLYSIIIVIVIFTSCKERSSIGGSNIKFKNNNNNN